MSKYEVMSNGIKIEIEAEYYQHHENLKFIGSINFFNLDENDKKLKKYVAKFKDWSYVRKV